MPATLKLANFDGGNIREKSYVDSDYTSGVSLTIKSVQNFSTGSYALVGTMGQEQCELRLIDGASGQVLTLHTALTYSHNKYNDVTALNYNQLKIYRAANVDGTTPADGSFSLLATIDIDPDNLTTTYNDSTGGSAYWYKYTYLNQSTAAETALADSTAVQGGTANHYATLDDIRAEAGFGSNTFVSDVTIAEARDAAEGEVNSALSGTYDLPFADPVPSQITYIVKQLAAGYLLSTDYGPFASGTSKDGEAKKKEARDDIMNLKMQSGELLDPSGNSLVLAGRVNGWPDNSTADADSDENGGARLNRITDVY